MTFAVKIALGLLSLYVVLVLVFAAMQTSLVFPRALVGPAPALPAQTERLTLTRPDGVHLHGVRIEGQDAAAPVILGFGGNAWNAESMALFLHQIAPEHTVVAFHYRGYAPSEGRPSADSLIADGIAIRDTLGEDVIAVGFSVGSGVAAKVAEMRPLRGAILVTPFDSLGAVARDSLPWAPVRWLFRHDIDALGALQATDMPLALILASRDEVIPPARAEALVDGVGDKLQRVARLNAGHNDIYNRPDFAPALRAHLNALQ